MKIIFAQGNPGPEYAWTRHNVGFLAIDELATRLSVSFAPKPKFFADIAETTLKGEKILLVKPTTFYNETGASARALVDFYKLDPTTDFVVLHDDLALPFGTIRTRTKGSDAGNNGIKSLNAHLGQHYARVRIGIYSEFRDRMNDIDFVIGRFSAEEKESLPQILHIAADFAQQFADGAFEHTHTSLS